MLTTSAIPSETNPGTATISEISVHWHVCSAVARRIVGIAGVQNVSETCRPRYRWSDIWRVEGAGAVRRADWATFRAPLLTASDLSSLDPRGRSSRTWRRNVAMGKLPSITLADGIVRVRGQDFDAWVHYV